MLRSSSMASASLLASLFALLSFTACPTPPPVDGQGEGEGEDGGEEGEGEEGEGEEGEGEEGEGEDPGDGDCPVVAGGNSVCDVQDPASDNPVAVGGLATLLNVTATTPKFVVTRDNETDEPTRFGVYVTDIPVKARSGVLVTWTPDVTSPEIAIGDVLTIAGTHDEFTQQAPNTETRVSAQTITAVGPGAAPAPFVVVPDDLASESAGEDFEGVLVKLDDVTVTETGQFGQFTITGGIVTDDIFFRYSALADEELESITGVVSYNIFTGGGFRVLPRQSSDVVGGERPTTSVTELNDGTVTRCAFDAINQCTALVTGVVVSPTFFITDDDVRGPKFGFYIADPLNVDAAGRLQEKSGILVTITPENTREIVSLDGYTFDQTDFALDPGAAPEIGDTVEAFGDNSANFDNSEFRFVTSLKKVGTTTPPLPALFGTGGRDVALLKGGRPAAAAGDFETGFDPPLENVARAANIEDWEGVLVELQGVETTEACYAQVFTPAGGGTAFARDFGNFLVTGDVEIGDLFRLEQSFGGFFLDNAENDIPDTDKTCANRADKCEDSRVDAQDFTSLIGIVNFSFNVHRVNPRIPSDIDATPGFVAENTPAGNCPAGN